MAKSKSLPFISYYVPAYKKESSDGKTIPDAYGPRIFDFRGQNQFDNILELLRKKQSSRRAVLQIFDAADIPAQHVPCTCSIQFIVRGLRLNAITFMRSNDAYKGLPHDVFAFTMIQEFMARELDLELGWYKHAVGSLHLYEEDLPGAESYLSDGLHELRPMPSMPMGSQRVAVAEFLKLESKIRAGKKVDLDQTKLPPYWLDLTRLLRIYAFYKAHDKRGMERHLKKMSSPFYDQYVSIKTQGIKLSAEQAKPAQPPLFGESVEA